MLISLLQRIYASETEEQRTEIAQAGDTLVTARKFLIERDRTQRRKL